MKFLVLGANGMAGHVISLYLNESGHDSIGFVRRPTNLFDYIIGDARNLSLLDKVIFQNEFDFVVNAIGILNQNAEDNKDEAVFINSYLPHYLAKMTERENVRVIHLSTDCVFCGNTGPYSEASMPDGRTFYDRTKALGELNDNKNITLRNSIVGPDMKADGIGLLNWFLQQDGIVKGYTGAIWTGLTTLELAKAIEHLASEGNSGLVNMVPDDSISKYDLLHLFNKHINKNRLTIEASDELQLDKALTRTNRKSSFVPLDYDAQIEDLSRWMTEHKQLYPHYSL